MGECASGGEGGLSTVSDHIVCIYIWAGLQRHTKLVAKHVCYAAFSSRLTSPPRIFSFRAPRFGTHRFTTRVANAPYTLSSHAVGHLSCSLGGVGGNQGFLSSVSS